MTDSISSVTNPSPGDVLFNAPNFDVYVNNAIVPFGIRELITSVEYESADGIADVLKVEMVDPRMNQVAGLGATDGTSISKVGGSQKRGPIGVSDLDIFQPGKEIHVRMGYGSKLDYVGRGVIRRVRKVFPSGGAVPTMSITAYSKDSIMMDNQPNTSKFKVAKIETEIIGETKEEKKARRKKERARNKGINRSKVVQFKSYIEAIERKARAYGLTLDIDKDPVLVGRKFTHNAKLSDFDLLQCISHVTGYLFWIDANEAGEWFCHFKRPATIRKCHIPFNPPDIDGFFYSNNDQGTLLSFEPEWFISGALTALKVVIRDPKAGVIKEIEVKVQNNEDAPSYRPTKTDLIDGTLGELFEVEEIQSALDVKVVIGEYSWTPVVNRKFRTNQELADWAKQWYRKHRENFILANGTCVGIPRLYARQTHKIDGIGPALSGDYYFTRVAHKCSAAGGYMIDFSCRKSPKQLEESR